jgi:hypothetical protein
VLDLDLGALAREQVGDVDAGADAAAGVVEGHREDLALHGAQPSVR